VNFAPGDNRPELLLVLRLAANLLPESMRYGEIRW
jgi:hypothetical protein